VKNEKSGANIIVVVSYVVVFLMGLFVGKRLPVDMKPEASDRSGTQNSQASSRRGFEGESRKGEALRTVFERSSIEPTGRVTSRVAESSRD
jgi:hypothetical protein